MFIIAVVILVYLDLSPIQHDTPDNETIMIGKIFSDIDYINVVTTYINKYGLDNYDDVAYIGLESIPDDRLKILYDEILYYVNKENNYSVNIVSIYNLEDIYI